MGLKIKQSLTKFRPIKWEDRAPCQPFSRRLQRYRARLLFPRRGLASLSCSSGSSARTRSRIILCRFCHHCLASVSAACSMPGFFKRPCSLPRRESSVDNSSGLCRQRPSAYRSRFLSGELAVLSPEVSLRF